MERSLNRLFKRHDILRTIFIYKGLERPLQLVLEYRQIDFYHEDISGLTSRDEKETYIKDFKEKDRRNLFDLNRDALMRLTVLQVETTEYEVIWTHHHILMDGWCLGIIISEFFEIYSSDLENRKDGLAPVKPFKTYIQWLERQDKQKARNYWGKYLEQYERATGFPVNNKNKKSKNEGNQEKFIFQLEKEKGKSLDELSGRNHVTLNTLIQAIWGIILGKYNGREDVVFGTVVSGRPTELEGIETMVGLFINTIPVRIRFQGDLKFNELLQTVHKDAMNSEPYHYCPLVDIQSQSILKQNLFTHILAFENFPSTERLEGLWHKNGDSSKRLKLELSDSETFGESNYDLNVVIMPLDRLIVKFEYNTDLYESTLFRRIETLFKRIVDKILADEKIAIKQLTLLSEEEKSELLKLIRSKKGQKPMENLEKDKEPASILEANFNF
jgi:iturin family lipopeptide synthetase B/iturin family lipopeptide synthetase C